MKYNLSKLPLFSLLLYAGFSHAQTAELRFKHITTDQGLSASAITCITKDRHGYMWFGTYDGLNKFDGYEFQVYRNKSSEARSISSNAILALYEDRKGRLWIGTQNGLNLYDRPNDAFTSFRNHTGVILTVVDIEETANGDLLFLASDQIFKVRMADSTCAAYEPERLAPYLGNFTGLRRLFLEHEGTLWVLMETNGVVRFDPVTAEIKHYAAAQQQQHGLSSDRMIDMVRDKSGGLWVATKDGLFLYDNKTGRFAAATDVLPEAGALTNNNCYSLFIDADDNIWIGTSRGGLNLLPYTREKFQALQHDPQDAFSLNNNSVQAVLVDEQKNLWAGTLKGINFAQNETKSFDTFRHEPNRAHSLSDNAAAAFCETAQNNFWIATDGGGLNYFDRQNARFTTLRSAPNNIHTPRSDAILALYEDARGNLWVGGFLAGLSILHKDRRRFTHVLHSQDGLIAIKNDDVRHISEDRRGDIWVATNGDGIFQFHGGEPSQYRQYLSDLQDSERSLRTNYCITIFEDSEDMLWVGTYKGLSRFDRKHERWNNYTTDGPDSSGLSNNWIYTICEDSRGQLWVGTARGLNLFDRATQTFTAMSVQEGLPGDIINGIMEDGQGCLWISTNNGLAKYHPQEGTIVVYTEHDGLQGAEYIHGAYAKLSTGEMLFGGTNGFSIFKPEKVRTNVKFPITTLTKLRILDQVVESEDTPRPFEKILSNVSNLTLTYKQARIFTLFFSALEYSSPEKIKYRYLLEGYHDNWIDAGSNRSATFMKLSPGNYVFRVTASNSEGVWSGQRASLSLKILPPWWRTWYAYFAYGIIAVLLFVGYHRYSLKLMRLRMDLKTQKIEMEKAHELEELKSRFFTNISHEFRTPLTLILVPLLDLIKRGRKQDWPQLLAQFRLMKRSAERLLRLVNQVIDFNKIEAGKLELHRKEIDAVKFTKDIVETFTPMAADKHITLEFGSNCIDCYAAVDPDKLDIVIFNLLSNAFKFTPEHGGISVTVKQCAPLLEICVKDSGPGVPAEHIDHIFDRFYHVDQPVSHVRQGAGIGLSLSKELIELHGGEILAHNEPGRGACFVVRLPIGEIPIHDHHLRGSTPPASARTEELENEFVLAEPRNAAEPVLLIVEDDGDLRDYLHAELQGDYHVLTASNGQKGLELALAAIPDLILSDIMMFEMDGLELCKRLKTNPLTSHIPTVLLTARSAENQQLEGLETGADDYLTKPFNLEILKKRIHNLLESRRALRERFSHEVRLKPKEVVITSLDEQFLERAIRTVETRLSDPDFDVQAFSHEMGLSRAQLFRKLKALTSERPLEFIQTVRLKRAACLLEETQMNVTEICFEVGFNYPSHFAKLFHARFGRSPKKYRRELQVVS